MGSGMNRGTVMSDVAARSGVYDRLALLEMEGDYARCFDMRDGTGWANLFTEDGVYQGATIPGMPDPTPPHRWPREPRHGMREHARQEHPHAERSADPDRR